MTTRRTIFPSAKVLDSKTGLVEYVASDETIDSYREVIRVSGWKFDLFKKNAPFVDSHNYDTIANLVGHVVDFRLDRVNGKPCLVETVQWAIDVPENKLAAIGFKMTEAGHLRAVSVGFWPLRLVSKWDQDPGPYTQQLLELGMAGENAPRVVYLEQQQVELSACVLGANPNALAKSYCQAYKAGVISDADLETLSSELLKRATASQANDSTVARLARQWTRLDLLESLAQ